MLPAKRNKEIKNSVSNDHPVAGAIAVIEQFNLSALIDEWEVQLYVESQHGVYRESLSI